MKRCLLVALCLSVLTVPVKGQEYIALDTLKTSISFRDGSTEVEDLYGLNFSRLNTFIYEVKNILSDPYKLVRVIEITSEGSTYEREHGEKYDAKALHWGRRKHVWDYFTRRLLTYPVDRGYDITRTWKVDKKVWPISALAEARCIVEVYDTVVNDGTGAYYFGENAFRRKDTVVIVAPASVVADTVTEMVYVAPVVMPDAAVSRSEYSDFPKKWGFMMNIKNNAFYDVFLVPNLTLEFNLGGKWSIHATGAYAGWNSHSNDFIWNVTGIEFGIRKWFGRRWKPLTGHHIGLYGEMAKYDMLLFNRGYLSDGWNCSMGIEYGFCAPIGRRFSIDLTLGLGYFNQRYKRYHVSDIQGEAHYVWDDWENRTMFFPTKVEVSFVWQIGHNNHNDWK